MASGLEFKVENLGMMASGSGFRVEVFRFKVKGFECVASGSECMIYGWWLRGACGWLRVHSCLWLRFQDVRFMTER